MKSHAQLADMGLGKLPSTYFEDKSGLNYRFYVAEDIVKAGGRPPVTFDDEMQSTILDFYSDIDRVALYVHVPWCVETCTYCYYWGKVESKSQMAQLFNAEKEHLKLIGSKIDIENKEIPSIYFGGGTPTVLPVELLEEYLDFFVGRFADSATEVCSEASISSLTAEKISIMKKYVTRLSLGVQTFSDRLLKAVARSFTADKAKEVIRTAVENFHSVNIDLIYGLQNQTMADWIDAIQEAIRLEVPSVTLYRLEIRVPMMIQEYRKDQSTFPDEITCREMRHRARYLLEQAGYRENLVGWFVKSKVTDTVVYRERWARQTPCLAFGPGVHNYGSDYFYYNTLDKDEYIARVERGSLPVHKIYCMQDKEQLLWFIIAQWKSNLPVYLNEIRARFGAEGESFLRTVAGDFSKWNLLSISDEGFVLTDGGKSILEWMICDMMRRIFA